MSVGHSLDRVNWGPLWVILFPMQRILDCINVEKGSWGLACTHPFTTLFLTEDITWEAASSSWGLDFPIIIVCSLELWPRISPFSFKLLLSYQQETELRQTLSPSLILLFWTEAGLFILLQIRPRVEHQDSKTCTIPLSHSQSPVKGWEGRKGFSVGYYGIKNCSGVK